MKIKRILACLCASMVMALSFTACGSEDSSSKEESSATEEVTEAATEAETEAEAAGAADGAGAAAEGQVQNAVVIEDSVIAEDGDAYLAFADGRYVGYYWGTDADTLTYAATNAKIEGNGQYTVALDASSTGYSETTGYTDMQGLTFAAVIVKSGTTLYPNMVITIDSIKLDGTEVEMTKKPYTSSDDGVEMRSNIYNGYVDANSVPDDARTADSDLTNCSPQVVDPASFGTYQKIEVTFTVSGL
ncbi:MAG: hypothetical protein ACI4I9_00260 [Porcipelethomonas sp.]